MRKKRESSKMVTVGVYLSDLEVRMVKKQARDRGLSVSVYLRSLIQRKGENCGSE